MPTRDQKGAVHFDSDEKFLATRDIGEELRTAAGRGDIETVKSIVTRGVMADAYADDHLKKQRGEVPKDRDYVNDYHKDWNLISWSPRFDHRKQFENWQSPPEQADADDWTKRKGLTRTLGALPTFLEAKDRAGLTALAWAAQKGHVDIAELLLEYHSDVEARDGFGRTPLMIAAAEGHTQVVKLLVDRSKEINSKDQDGRTALAWAASRGRLETAQVLVDVGADLEVPDQLGYRALTWAAVCGSMPIVELLLDRECELEALDVQGLTPLVLAAMQGHDAVAHRLAAEGARVPLDLRDMYTQLKPVGRRPKKAATPVQDTSRIHTKDQPDAAATELGDAQDEIIKQNVVDLFSDEVTNPPQSASTAAGIAGKKEGELDIETENLDQTMEKGDLQTENLDQTGEMQKTLEAAPEQEPPVQQQ